MEKKGGELFDVTMGAYDGTKNCELVVLFILFEFQQFNKIKNFGPYRDYGLAVVKNMSGLQSQKVKKELQVLFKKFCLNLIIEFDKATVDYLDITLNLLDGTYKPYQKPENTLQYIHKESNHLTYIIKKIPIKIETQLSNHSSKETVFQHAAEDYEKALKNSGYNFKLQYKPTNQNPKNKINRKRNII